ncbi:MAG: thiamine ABC transporter substrate-binding protein [Promicromonosporaceae bacterium]|nr:thiamine ABC transporter substrate-binding protein [Promicromonosporaceae bacterium]
MRLNKSILSVSAAVFAVALGVSGCGGTTMANDTATPVTADTSGGGGVTETPTAIGDTVTLVTTNSFAISPETQAAFTEATGLELIVLPVGSAGVLANQLVLTADHPLGDVFFGVDNTFASRLLDHGVTEAYLPAGLPASALAEVIGDGLLVPVTQGDVCLNIDRAWFAEHSLPEPTGFTSLVAPLYRGLTVVLNPAASSPGLAFLLATISYFDDGGTATAEGGTVGQDAAGSPVPSWQDFWRELFANDVFVADSWSTGYFTDFSGAGEGGTRPIVVSYASSPAATLNSDGTESTTAALLNTCFRQVQYAGILSGAANPSGARQLIDFLVGPEFQSELPNQMWVYPIDSEIALPADWANFAPQATAPWQVAPSAIEANREAWLEEWFQIATQ